MPNATPLLILIVSASAAAVAVMAWAYARQGRSLVTLDRRVDDLAAQLWDQYLRNDDLQERHYTLLADYDALNTELWETQQHLAAIRQALAGCIDAEVIDDDADLRDPWASDVPF